MRRLRCGFVGLGMVGHWLEILVSAITLLTSVQGPEDKVLAHR